MLGATGIRRVKDLLPQLAAYTGDPVRPTEAFLARQNQVPPAHRARQLSAKFSTGLIQVRIPPPTRRDPDRKCTPQGLRLR